MVTVIFGCLSLEIFLERNDTAVKVSEKVTRRDRAFSKNIISLCKNIVDQASELVLTIIFGCLSPEIFLEHNDSAVKLSEKVTPQDRAFSKNIISLCKNIADEVTEQLW